MSAGAIELDIADRAVARARALGADEAEVCVQRVRAASISLQKDDVRSASTEDETIVGVRVFRGGALGFATVNDPGRIDDACSEALALAKVTVPDERNGLGAARTLHGRRSAPDPTLCALDLGALVAAASAFMKRVHQRDARVRIDSGSVGAAHVARAIATSRGVHAAEEYAHASGNVFGMAVDGADVGSFDYDGDTVCLAADLNTALAAAADRFVSKTVGALGAKPGESFKGPIVLAPEVVLDFVLGNVLPALSAEAVRNGRSPLGAQVGKRMASNRLTVYDDPEDPELVSSTPFDREGQPTKRLALISEGVLNTLLYDVFEARLAGRESSGHARGGASGPPVIGAHAPAIAPGDDTFVGLCTQEARTVLVSRFSGTTNPTSGEFSGVVKGGFLFHGADRIPIRETTIAGNLYDALRRISGISRERRLIEGTARMPSIRIEDISITAG